MKKFLLAGLISVFAISGCSNNLDSAVLQPINQEAVQTQSNTPVTNGLLNKTSYSLIRYKTNISKTYVEGIVVSMKQLLGKDQVDTEFKFVDDRINNMTQEMHGALLVGKDQKVYFVPRKSSTYDPMNPVLDHELLNGLEYVCYQLGDRVSPFTYKDNRIVNLLPAYSFRLIQSPMRKDHFLNQTNKEMEVFQKDGRLFITRKMKITDFKLENL
jgi:hypothetical protein